MSFGQRFLNCCKIHWNGFFFVITPLILLPLLFLESRECKTLFVIFWAFIWYAIDVAPLAATAFLPVVLYPVLGVMKSNSVCMSYCGDANQLFILCNFIAVTIQHSNVATRYAFFILANISRNPRKILIFLMCWCYVLTAFFPASFVGAIMMPTIRAIMGTLENINVSKTIDESVEIKDDERPYPSKVSNAFFIGTAFAINIGSITMNLCSASGLSLRELSKKEPSLSSLDNGFDVKYLLASLPVSLLLLIVTIVYLEIIFFGFQPIEGFDKDATKGALNGLANDLPPFNIAMCWVVVLLVISLFGTLVCGILIPEVNSKLLKFSFNAMLLTFFYFVLPSDCDFCNYFVCAAPKQYKTSPSILPWGPVNRLTPWKSYFVFGSSMCFGMVMQDVDLQTFVGKNLLQVDNLMAQQIGFIGLTLLFTVMGSNDHVADIMLKLGLTATVDKSATPLLYPITWASSMTFLLPLSSPANCFAIGWGEVRAKDMILAAIVPTLFGFLIAVVMGRTL